MVKRKNKIIKIIKDCLNIIRRGIKYYSFYFGSFAYDKWTKIVSKNDLEKKQFKKFKKLLDYAYANVPFYHERFNEIGLHPSDIKSREDIVKTPILTGNDIRSNFPDRIISKKGKVKKSNVFSSSGSTGESVYFIKSKDWKVGCYMGLLRMQNWKNSKVAILTTPTCSGNTCSITDSPENLEDKIRSFLIRTHINPFIYLPSSKNIIMEQDEYFLELVEIIASFKPKYFFADPVYLVAFAKFLKKNNIKISGIKGVTTTFELLLKAHKKIIEEVFECNVYTQYGCSELRDIANECELKKLHVRMDAVYTEYIWDNKPVASGEKGKLVITNLVNYKMPLIRYEVGDTVRWSNKKCSCGRNTTVIENIEGRNADYLFASDQSAITQRDIDEILSKVDFIDYYQVVQNDFDNLDIFFMTSDELSEENLLPQNIVDEINSLFKIPVQINFQRVREILPRQSKKYRFVYSKINSPIL